MSLDDGGRAAYRAQLYEQAWRERFGPIPWAEAHRKPSPLVKPRRLVRRVDPVRATARRRALLNAAMGDPCDESAAA